MFTTDDIIAVIEKAISTIDARFIYGVEQDGVVDINIDDAIIRVSLNQRVVREFVVTEEQKLADEEDRRLLFQKYAAPVIAEFVDELRMKAKRVVVCVQPVRRRDPDRITSRIENSAPRLAASSVDGKDGSTTFVIEMRFGTFNI